MKEPSLITRLDVPDEVAATSIGRRLILLLTLVQERRELKSVEFEEQFAPRTPPGFRGAVNKDLGRAVLAHPAEPVGWVEWGEVGENLASAILTLASGDRVAVVARDGSGVSFTVIQRVPSEIEVRPVAESDAPALRELERRTPLEIGDASISYDKGEDYFVGDLLMGSVDSLVLTVDGRPAGLFSQLARRVVIDGEERTLVYLHRMRIAPDAQGRGLRRILNFFSMATTPSDVETPCGFIAAANHRMIESTLPEVLWSAFAERVVIDTAQNAGGRVGRVATADDADLVVTLLNDGHSREEFFVPYTIETLGERLSRVPQSYGWRDLRVGDDAVLGVWFADWEVSRTVEGRTTVDRRALVLDYGFREGAEEAFVSLVRSICGELSAAGITELSVFTSAGSRGRDTLASLAKRIEPYRVRTPIPEPADAANHGVYVDQLYF